MTHTAAHKALTEDQQGRLLRAAERRGALDHALVALALTAGLRDSEIASLNDADISVNKGHVQVAPIKAGIARQVPLSAQTLSVVTGWREHRGPASCGLRDAALFVGRDGRRLRASSVGRVIREAGRDAGLEISTGTLRHTFATNQARAGASAVVVASLLGHARVDLARFYTTAARAN